MLQMKLYVSYSDFNILLVATHRKVHESAQITMSNAFLNSNSQCEAYPWPEYTMNR